MKLDIEIDRASFLSFKSSYPRREGSNPWSHAEKKFNALVKSGIDPMKIIAGAKRFSSEEAKNIGSRFIPMAVTWLNQQRFDDFEPEKIDEPFAWDQILVTFKKFGHWSRYAGPHPDSPACRCPSDMLEKYGIIRT